MNRPLVVIFAAIALDAVGIGFIFPILPRLLEDVTHTQNIRTPARHKTDLAALNPLRPFRWVLSIKGLLPIIFVFFILSAAGEADSTCWALWGFDTFHWRSAAQSPSFRRGDSHVLHDPFRGGRLNGRFGGDSRKVVILDDGEAEPCEQRVHFVRGKR